MNPLTTQKEIDSLTLPCKCGNCELPNFGGKMESGWGFDRLCQDCFANFERTEIQDGGPWVVSWQTYGTARRERDPNPDYYQAKLYAIFWKAQMFNNSGHLIFDFEKQTA